MNGVTASIRGPTWPRVPSAWPVARYLHAADPHVFGDLVRQLAGKGVALPTPLADFLLEAGAGVYYLDSPWPFQYDCGNYAERYAALVEWLPDACLPGLASLTSADKAALDDIATTNGGVLTARSETLVFAAEQDLRRVYCIRGDRTDVGPGEAGREQPVVGFDMDEGRITTYPSLPVFLAEQRGNWEAQASRMR